MQIYRRRWLGSRDKNPWEVSCNITLRSAAFSLYLPKRCSPRGEEISGDAYNAGIMVDNALWQQTPRGLDVLTPIYTHWAPTPPKNKIRDNLGKKTSPMLQYLWLF
jgi:hypothetical protein